MKKEFKKLILNKRTISNLGSSEMNKIAGGRRTDFCNTERQCTGGCGPSVVGCTQHGHTCNGNNC